jgi:hypothetical protein
MNDEVSMLVQQLRNAGSGPVPPSAQDRFHQLVENMPQEALSRGLTDAFNSERTPDFGDMVARMFGQANPEQKTHIVNRLLGGLGPMAHNVLNNLGLRDLAGDNAAVPPVVSTEQAAKLLPSHVQELATHAKPVNPGIVESMSNFYAQHPVLVKSLGAAALSIILGQVRRTH